MSKQTMYFYDFIPVDYDVSPEREAQILSDYPLPELPSGDDFFDLQTKEKDESIKTQLLLNDFKEHMTRQNKPFLRIRFSNNLGTIDGVLWDNQGQVERYKPILEAGSIFNVEGRVSEFNNKKTLTIHKLTECEDDINPFSLLPYTKQDISTLTVELFAYLDELRSPFKELAFAAMNQFWKEFRTSPAAKGFHHNYLGGLLKHTVGLMRFARYMLKFEESPYKAMFKLISVVEKAHKNMLWEQIQSGDHSERVVWQDSIDHLYTMLQGMMEHQEDEADYDLIMTSILYHDIGKLLEYDYAGKSYDAFSFLFPTATKEHFKTRKETGITMDDLGVMIGHIPYGFYMLTKIVEKEEIELAMEDIHAMSHCILCHHGLPEWGSCVRKPQTIEGYIIHIVDFLDSRYENTEVIK